MQNRAGLRHFLDSFSGVQHTTSTSNNTVVGSVEPSLGTTDKQDYKDGNPTTDTRLVDLLDSTLWNRKLAPSSERIVYALVQQIFHGIREHFLISAELKVSDLICDWLCHIFVVVSKMLSLPCSAVQLFSLDAGC